MREELVPIALGENVYSAEAFANFLALSAVDVVQVDVTRVAGISEWLRVASAAQSAARAVIPHAGDMMQVHQHLVAATSPARVPMIEYLPWGLEVFEDPVQITRGTITLPSKPGASSSVAKDRASGGKSNGRSYGRQWWNSRSGTYRVPTGFGRDKHCQGWSRLRPWSGP